MEVRSKPSCDFEDQFEHEHAGYLSTKVVVERQWVIRCPPTQFSSLPRRMRETGRSSSTTTGGSGGDPQKQLARGHGAAAKEGGGGRSGDRQPQPFRRNGHFRLQPVG
jgi:hypothetical protein